MRRHLLLSMLLVPLLAGCGPDGSDTAAEGLRYLVKDSSGVEIVTSGPVGALGPGPLRLVEQLRIGVVEGEEPYELFAVRDVVLGEDGDIYAAEQNTGEIRVFAPDGTYRMTVGGQGEGPGEFLAVTWIGVFGDTLLAYDPRLSRVTAFATDGVLLDTWPASNGGARFVPQARASDGWLVTLDDFSARVPYGIDQPGTDTARIGLVRSMDELSGALSPNERPWERLPVVVQYPSWTLWGVGSASGAVFGRSPLWEPRPYSAFDAQGRIYVARGGHYAVDVFGPDGQLLRRLSREDEPVPITDALVDRYRSEVMAHYDTAGTTGEAGLDLVEAARQHIALPKPDHVPPLGQVAVSDEGAVWVERPDRVDDPVLLEWSSAGTQPEHWDVFDPDGRFLGTVELPADRATIHVVGTDWAVLTVRDELDVQYIVRYSLVRPEGGP